MNIIFSIIIGTSIICLIFTAPELVLSAMLSGSNSALLLCFELLAIYAVWLGVLGIVENTKISKCLAKILSPLINKLWGNKDIDSKAKNYLALSLSVQVLGIGGASVPLGIKAIECMDKKTGTATYPMIMTIVFAASGVQLIPSTIMSLMYASGSANPSFIILPTILSGLCTTIVGIILTIIMEKLCKKLGRIKLNNNSNDTHNPCNINNNYKKLPTLKKNLNIKPLFKKVR